MMKIKKLFYSVVALLVVTNSGFAESAKLELPIVLVRLSQEHSPDVKNDFAVFPLKPRVESTLSHAQSSDSKILFTIKSPLDPCGDMEVLSSDLSVVSDGVVILESFGLSVHGVPNGAPLEKSLAKLSLTMTDSVSKVSQIVKLKVVDVLEGTSDHDVKLVDWLQYATSQPFTAKTKNGDVVTIAFHHAEQSLISGTFVLNSKGRAQTGQWHFAGNKLTLTQSGGKSEVITVNYIDSPPNDKIGNVEIDQTYPYFWFEWQKLIFVSQYLANC